MNKITILKDLLNGENDYGRRNMVFSELPLYLANMQKGDFSLYRHLSPDGADPAVVTGVEYQQDPEVGALMRTQDFRIALSIAWDRVATSEALAFGSGAPQNMIPHPSTPYYPGDQWLMLDVNYDPDRAKGIMANLGYTDGDGDGFLDRKDGGGPLTLLHSATSSYFPYAELGATGWENIGIKVDLRQGSPAPGFRGIPVCGVGWG